MAGHLGARRTAFPSPSPAEYKTTQHSWGEATAHLDIAPAQSALVERLASVADTGSTVALRERAILRLLATLEHNAPSLQRFSARTRQGGGSVNLRPDRAVSSDGSTPGGGPKERSPGGRRASDISDPTSANTNPATSSPATQPASSTDVASRSTQALGPSPPATPVDVSTEATRTHDDPLLDVTGPGGGRRVTSGSFGSRPPPSPQDQPETKSPPSKRIGPVKRAARALGPGALLSPLLEKALREEVESRTELHDNGTWNGARNALVLFDGHGNRIPPEQWGRWTRSVRRRERALEAEAAEHQQLLEDATIKEYRRRGMKVVPLVLFPLKSKARMLQAMANPHEFRYERWFTPRGLATQAKMKKLGAARALEPERNGDTRVAECYPKRGDAARVTHIATGWFEEASQLVTFALNRDFAEKRLLERLAARPAPLDSSL